MTLPLARQTLIGARHALGHPQIDCEHFAIADCWAKVVQSAPIALPLNIARLRKAMRIHFENEASLLESANISFCSHHRYEHDVMLRLCDEAYGEAKRNWRSSQRLLRTLPKLMREHIICADQIAVMMLNAAAPAARRSWS